MTTNKEVSQSQQFHKKCAQAGEILGLTTEAVDKLKTSRQASKYRRQTGIVWKALNNQLTT